NAAICPRVTESEGQNRSFTGGLHPRVMSSAAIASIDPSWTEPSSSKKVPPGGRAAMRREARPAARMRIALYRRRRGLRLVGRRPAPADGQLYGGHHQAAPDHRQTRPSVQGAGPSQQVVDRIFAWSQHGDAGGQDCQGGDVLPPLV